MKLSIYKLGGKLYEGEATSINLPTESGQITVLPHHISLITHLQKGTAHVKNGSETHEFPIISGFAEIKNDQVTLLVE